MLDKAVSDDQAIEMATAFFRRLGDIAQSYGVIMYLEPNPSCYGANFMTTSAETARIVKQVSHPAVRMQLDTGALTINGDDPAAVLQNHAALIGYIHASEPDLVPLGDGGADHGKVAESLRRFLSEHLVSIEMFTTSNEPHLASFGAPSRRRPATTAA